jgi:N utilization substance protein B
VKKDRRHRAREAALQILYQWEIARGDVGQAATTFFTHQWPDREAPADELRAFASTLARDTVDRLEAIDALIAETADRWRPERMAVLDRLVIRMAACELIRDPGTPAAVVINEALELGRTFSTEESVKFINGMLDAIRKKIESHPLNPEDTKDTKGNPP